MKQTDKFVIIRLEIIGYCYKVTQRGIGYKQEIIAFEYKRLFLFVPQTIELQGRRNKNDISQKLVGDKNKKKNLQPHLNIGKGK